MTDWFKANAIPQVVETVKSDEFDNAIRSIGVGYACEWFGFACDGRMAKEAVNALCVGDEPFTLKDGEYITKGVS